MAGAIAYISRDTDGKHWKKILEAGLAQEPGERRLADFPLPEDRVAIHPPRVEWVNESGKCPKV